ncbi:TPA: peptide-methionine (S)-S-oxide reductase MsrA [Candidatus Woesearchaeota archaeon]|nr:peptide-methionine (S)-S-oxide reductase MsrA [Candidatus Woesearchaeota archaeon]HIH12348.1 peptide-methionine (S)-S-oxide reductase MsrA [Candidatus Woesearchaeota archaeon]
MPKTETATFAAGCFWGVEEAFAHLQGVLSTTVGYTGGKIKSPTYRQVCSDTTGHAEAVEIKFDPTIVSYEKILDIFWSIHDPTTLNRQGPNYGSQYRSAIFFHNKQQQKAALLSKEKAQTKYGKPIVTQIIPATAFYPAEEYHQHYLQKKGSKSCGV